MEILEIKGNWKSPSVLFNPDGNLQMWGDLFRKCFRNL